MTPAELARDADNVRAEYAEMVGDQMRAAAWEAEDRWGEDEWDMRTDAERDAARRWSRDLWMETGNGYY